MDGGRINRGFNIAEIIAIILVIASSMNFAAKYFYIVVMIAVWLIIMNRGRIYIHSAMIFLLILSCCLAVSDIIQRDSFGTILKNMAFPICYMTGLLWIDCFEKKTGKKPEKALSILCFAIAVGYISHVFLNFQLNIVSGGINIGRNTIDIWSGAVFSATGQAALFVVCVGVAISCFFSDFSKQCKALAVVICAIAFGHNLQLACRTPLVLSAIVMMIAIVHMLKSAAVKKSKKQLIMLQVLFLFAAVMIAYGVDLFGIRTRLEGSNLFLRLISMGKNQFESGRMGLRLHYIREIWQYPFGGSNLLKKYGYAHDLLFDTWDKAGLLAMVSVVLFTVGSIRRLYAIVRNPNLAFKYKQLILCVYCSIFLEFLVEPILYGLPWLFATFCMIDGAVARLLYLKRGHTHEADICCR